MPTAHADGPSRSRDILRWLAKCIGTGIGKAVVAIVVAVVLFLAGLVWPVVWHERVVLSPTQLTVTEGEGDGGEHQVYEVSLRKEPRANVSVLPFSTNLNVATVAWRNAPEPLIFTTSNWSTPQRVRVVPTNEDGNDDPEKVIIGHGVAGGGYERVAGPVLTADVREQP